MHLTKITNKAENLAPALQGSWGREWKDKYRLTIVKSHAYLSSIIFSEQSNINLQLPEHWPFYLQILSPSGSTNILVENSIELTMEPGQQFSAQFTLKL